MDKKTLLINLYGAPCSRKSTFASKLYTELKQLGKSVELVREFATEWAWEDREIKLYDHIYIVANQIHRETILYDRVDYLITDSPVPLGAFYDEFRFKHKLLRSMIEQFLESRKQQINVIDYWLPLNKDFLTTQARYHSFDEISRIDKELRLFIEQMGVNPIEVELITADMVLG